VLELEIETTIDRALAAVADSDARVEALSRGVEHLTEVARIEQLALDVGAGVQTDYLRAEADLFAARAALAEVRHGALAARVALARATGELSTEWIALNLEIDR
jgi:outer membrane protein TolC